VNPNEPNEPFDPNMLGAQGDDDPRDARLDAMLRRAYAPPADETMAAIARSATAAEPSRRLPWQWLLAAAALLLTFAIWHVTRPPVGPEGHDGKQLGALWAAAYEHALANREAADGKRFCCDPSLDFCRTCEQRFAVRLGLGQSGPGVTLRGCYCGLSTGGCVAALIDTAAGPVGVFVLPRAEDPEPELPGLSKLRLARREIGGLVLYAVGGEAVDPKAPLNRFELAP